MDWPISADLIGLVTYLLPGFLAASVFYSLTAHPKQSPFERVIQALIFTALVKAALPFVEWGLVWATRYRTLGRWTPDVAFIWSIGLALTIGLLVSLAINRDWIHWPLRKLGLTRNNSYSSEWVRAFTKSNKNAVTLHLRDERRIWGYPLVWPNVPQTGHFILEHPHWVDDENHCTELPATETLIVSGQDVEFVEFMKRESKCEDQDEQATAASPEPRIEAGRESALDGQAARQTPGVACPAAREEMNNQPNKRKRNRRR